MIKTAFAKIGSGLLTGIGFALALIGAAYGVQIWETSHRADGFGEGVYRRYKPDSGLTIKDQRPQKPAQNTSFIGTIQNEGKDTWESVQVVAELFDKDGQFVDKCSSYESGRIAPGQNHNFKVACGGCRDESVAPYDHYTISIVDANYVSPSR
jgi:hypothetical protein